MGPISRAAVRAALTITVVLGGLVVTSATPVQAAGCGAVQVAGKSWLAASGVDVKSNGLSQGTGVSCAGNSTSSPTIQNGWGWQCVELASRLYYVRGWGSVRADGGAGAGTYRFGAKFIPEGSPGLAFHANGSGYLPVPGDLIVEWSATWGHVSVIDSVAGNAIEAVEQNASSTGRHRYSLSGTTISGAYSGGSVRGVMHSARNQLGVDQLTGAKFKGDFNGDGTADIAILHGAVGTTINVWVLWGSKTQTPLASPQLVTTLPYSGGWRWEQIKAVSGDFNGDGTADIGIMHGAVGTSINVWALWGSKTQTPLTGKQLMTTLPHSGGWRWEQIKAV